jgi:uncharacterized membrane protein (Fun14 family)
MVANKLLLSIVSITLLIGLLEFIFWLTKFGCISCDWTTLFLFSFLLIVSIWFYKLTPATNQSVTL